MAIRPQAPTYHLTVKADGFDRIATHVALVLRDQRPAERSYGVIADELAAAPIGPVVLTRKEYDGAKRNAEGWLGKRPLPIKANSLTSC